MSVFYRFKLIVLYMFFFLKKKDNVLSCWFCKLYIYIVVFKDKFVLYNYDFIGRI